MGKIIDYFCLRVIQTRLTLYIIIKLYRVAAGMARITRTPIGLGAAELIYVKSTSLAAEILGGAEV